MRRPPRQGSEAPRPTVLFVGQDVNTAAALGVAARRSIRLETVSTARDALRLLATVVPALAIVEATGRCVDALLVISAIARGPSSCRVVLVGDPIALSLARVRTARIDELLLTPLRMPALFRSIEAATAASFRFSASVMQAIEHVRGHYAGPLTVESTAEAVGVSWSSLAHRFPLELEMTVGEYVRQVRVERARRLLIETRDKLETIAAATGFCDAAHLSRVFRRVVGVWPGHYRASGGSTAPLAASDRRRV